MSFAVTVDPTNPGQFFACCGLLELADRLRPGAEGWFADGQFHVTCEATLGELLRGLLAAEIHSSLNNYELKRLATLNSVAKASLTEDDLDDKQRLSEMWKRERVCLTAPFDIWVDWWRDERAERTAMKTWAAKQMVVDIAREMLAAIKAIGWSANPTTDELFQTSKSNSLPFNFDSQLCGHGTVRDAGFNVDVLELKIAFRPVVELAAFVGLQRFRPTPIPDLRLFQYCLWSTPLLPPVAAVAANGTLPSDNAHTFAFRLLNRTKYMKAFFPALPYRGDKT